MKQYKLPAVMHPPGERTENKYLAEIPLLEGCRAWGDSPAEALENLQDVASAFIRSFKDLKQSLPLKVEETAFEVDGPSDAIGVRVYL